ncbi:TIR domain-containing protein [Enterococcus casseliflavus]|uniref:TIR domain-containing protein n=1 Tax=Enterococcus casseliflavus TaxID=37734 RepID=UPI003EE0F663
MNLFLSWSGDRSKYLAECFKEWLPNVLQYVNPYMSAKDIDLGSRWSNDIDENLRVNDFGLVFVTEENIDAPWINFEAGALSKNLKSRLVPMIYDTDVTILNTGPLKQFQSAKDFSEASLLDLIQSINVASEDNVKLSQERLQASFDKWWPDLEGKLKKVPSVEEKNTSEDDKNFDTQALKMILNKLDVLEKRDIKSKKSAQKQIVDYSDLIELSNLVAEIKLRTENLYFTNDSIINNSHRENKNLAYANDASLISNIDLLSAMVNSLMNKYERY